MHDIIIDSAHEIWRLLKSNVSLLVAHDKVVDKVVDEVVNFLVPPIFVMAVNTIAYTTSPPCNPCYMNTSLLNPLPCHTALIICLLM